MSRNCLFTVNVGNFLRNYVRDRMLRACDRWDCDYVEIHDSVIPDYASCSKYIGAERLRGYYKILMLDADIVISDHAPSPFSFCTVENVLFAVGDYIQAPNHCQAWIDGPYKIGTYNILTEHPEYNAPAYETFFNGGFWMCVNNTNIRSLFRRALELIPAGHSEIKHTFYREQGGLNVLVHNDPVVKLCLLPETWNHIIPQDCQPVPEYYMNHFGGWAQILLKKLSDDYDAARVGTEA